MNSAALMVILLLAVMVLSWFGVRLVRSYALERLLDVPNERSSHAQPTPRGGGLAITVTHFVGLVVAAVLGVLPWAVACVFGAGLVVAFVGFLDDHSHVSPRWRLLCHLLAVLWAVGWIGGLPPVDFGWGPANLGVLGSALLVLYLVWFLNLFNFMDGIDGIAASQAIFMSVTGAMLACLHGAGADDALPLMLLAAATAAFLFWNWPPAKIFMGDVGSGYLGFSLGVLGAWTVGAGWLSPWVWLILGGAFLADATVTLLRRVAARVAFAEAHRSHAYQRLSRRWQSHRPVTLTYLAVNVLWLAPWALAAARWPSAGAAFAVVALAPLFAAAARLGAGFAGDLPNSPRN